MTEGLMPGWYSGQDNVKRYWDGHQWLTPSNEAATMDHSTEETPEPELGTEEPQAEPATTAGKRKRWPLVAAAAGIVALGGGGTAYALLSGPSTTQITEMCTDDVKAALKSPNTAEFTEIEVSGVHERYEYFAALLLMETLGDLDAFDGLGPTDVIVALELDEVDHEPEIAEKLEAWGATDGSKMRLVTGYVDSQNGYGAMVHSEFTCLFDGETAVTLSIGDNVRNADHRGELVDNIAAFSDE